jgi:protein-S-isoprenylcysteine O-methyltransferase Ste14
MIWARYLCLSVPAAAVLIAARLDRDRAAWAGGLLAFVAAAVGIAGLHEVATAAGWYAFAPVDGAYRGLPVDLWLGWAALWGPLPVLLRRAVPVPVALGLLLWLDVVAMPALDPLLLLGPHWLQAEALGILLVALPAQVLGRWTADRDHLVGRALLQVATFTGLTLWLVPSVAFTLGDGGWDRAARLPAPLLFVLAQIALAVAVPALAAVTEFVTRGGGTPFPWDPPQRLVTTGPYAYLANPMQAGTVLLLLLLAAATASVTLVAAALLAVAFSAAVAAPHERHDMRQRYGNDWLAYRREVRDWWPRHRPYTAGPPSRLWLDEDCGPCTAVRDFLREREPQHLEVLAAAAAPTTLWRASYDGADGHTTSGVAAVARGLHHLTLGWAYAGWLLMLPGVGWLTQLVTDALIAPPHPAGGRVAPQGEQ